MKRCQRCILPETPGFTLDYEGNCIFCSSPEMLAHVTVKPDKEKLEEMLIIVREKGIGKEFDCVVGLSGGRDSTAMLYQLVKKHDLRCAAFFGKTMFTPAVIFENVRRITDKLGVRLIEFTVPPDLHQRVAGYCLKMWQKTRNPIFGNLACVPCKLVNREIFRWAAVHDIRTVIYGGNRYEYFPRSPASIDLATSNRYSLLNMLKDSFIRIGKGLGLLISSPSLVRYLPLFLKASLLYVNQYTVFLRMRYPRILRFDYYHHADWDDDQVARILREVEWNLPEDCTSTWRADCMFEAVKNRIFQEELGFTHAEAFYSNLIRSGKIDRKDALDRIDRERISESRLRNALDLIGLPGFFRES